MLEYLPLMVVIRLARAGSVHRPFYHVVVTDSRSRRDSNHIERIGFLNYFASGGETPLKLDVDRVTHWVEKGAIVRPSVTKLLRRIEKGADTEAKPKARKKQKALAKAVAAAVEQSSEEAEDTADGTSASAEAAAEQPAPEAEPKPEQEDVAGDTGESAGEQETAAH